MQTMKRKKKVDSEGCPWWEEPRKHCPLVNKLLNETQQLRDKIKVLEGAIEHKSNKSHF